MACNVSYINGSKNQISIHRKQLHFSESTKTLDEFFVIITSYFDVKSYLIIPGYPWVWLDFIAISLQI